MKESVIIMGGGISGMSAAHELIERGFEVIVLEKKENLPGGKARSIPISGTASGGRKLLPGEHGFRFFPGFYKHVTDTMKRIPSNYNNSNSVYDQLVESPNILIVRKGFIPIQIPSRFPKSLNELKSIINTLFHTSTGLEKGESKLISLKLWQLMTSCKERKDNIYEKLSWWEFTEASNHSNNYCELFVDGLTRTLVAAKAEVCNTRTNGNVLLQLIFQYVNNQIANDRILNGPTNDVWLFPWLEYLTKAGVNYYFNSEVLSLETNRKQITGVWAIVSGQKTKQLLSADYYICALPVERAAFLFNNKEILDMDKNLSNVITLSQDVAWMNGIQFYLEFDIEINKGHIIFADTPWALTAISQAQFWRSIDLEREYGHGDIRGIVSVDVSDWDKNGIIYNKPARDCTKKEVIAEVWEQLKNSLNTNDRIVLSDTNLKMVFLDDSIIFNHEIFSFHTPSDNMAMNEMSKYGSNVISENDEPLLVNKINTWHLRNESRTLIPNLFLASDYVKTNTDLATMEGANEAARRAVNDILFDSKSLFEKCKIWELYEPDVLMFHKWLDKRRYEKGKDWKNFPLLAIVFYYIVFLLLYRSKTFIYDK